MPKVTHRMIREVLDEAGYDCEVNEESLLLCYGDFAEYIYSVNEAPPEDITEVSVEEAYEALRRYFRIPVPKFREKTA